MKHTNHRLTLDDAVQVWLHSWNGEYQHEIAFRFGVGTRQRSAEGKAPLWQRADCSGKARSALTS
ncbi:hypothetical protein [Rhizobium leguminosarum]|uniref:hypothetical protein n=1 Tax=Rhizobium leguminosarum TaxID=384 RepID=UPI001F2E9C54|nr:hypothetical protein [Rhizobium leguminosarum]